MWLTLSKLYLIFQFAIITDVPNVGYCFYAVLCNVSILESNGLWNIIHEIVCMYIPWCLSSKLATFCFNSDCFLIAIYWHFIYLIVGSIKICINKPCHMQPVVFRDNAVTQWLFCHCVKQTSVWIDHIYFPRGNWKTQVSYYTIFSPEFNQVNHTLSLLFFIKFR